MDLVTWVADASRCHYGQKDRLDPSPSDPSNSRSPLFPYLAPASVTVIVQVAVAALDNLWRKKVDHHNLLRRIEMGQQAVRRVRVVCEGLAFLPLVDCLLGNAVAAGRDASGFCAGCDLGAHGWGGAGILVQGNQHGLAILVDCSDSFNSLSTARAMNSG